MKIGGLQKTSLVDYPGHISSVIFTQGCMFRCRFCHNADLVDMDKTNSLIPEKDVIKFLEDRRGLIDAVVISGGEPAIQSDLISFITKVKTLGFMVKLDTTGYFPNVVKKLIQSNLIDYVAIDIKLTFERYGEITQAKGDVRRIQDSIQTVMSSSLDYEFRTTLPKEIISEDEIYQIADQIKGARRYILQKFNSDNPLDPTLKGTSTYSDIELDRIVRNISHYFDECFYR